MSSAREVQALLNKEVYPGGTVGEWCFASACISLGAAGGGLFAHYVLGLVESQVAALIAGGAGGGLLLGIVGIATQRSGFFTTSNVRKENANENVHEAEQGVYIKM